MANDWPRCAVIKTGKSRTPFLTIFDLDFIIIYRKERGLNLHECKRFKCRMVDNYTR